MAKHRKTTPRKGGEPPTRNERFVLNPRVDIARFVQNPDNPRLGFDDDEQIKSLAASIRTFGFGLQHAPLALLLPDDELLILSGHRRIEGAKLSNLESIPCWIADELSDEETSLIPLTSNLQSGLTRLEIGVYVRKMIKKSKGGRGKRGGRAAFAKTLALSGATVSGLVRAAEVYEETGRALGRPKSFAKNAQHLTLISKAPKDQWPTLVRSMVDERWTVKRTRAALAELMGPAAAPQEGAPADANESEAAAAAPKSGAQMRRRAPSRDADLEAKALATTDSVCNAGAVIPVPAESPATAPHPVTDSNGAGVRAESLSNSPVSAEALHSNGTNGNGVHEPQPEGGAVRSTCQSDAREAPRAPVREQVARFLREDANDLNATEAFALAKLAIRRLALEDLIAIAAQIVALTPTDQRAALGAPRRNGAAKS